MKESKTPNNAKKKRSNKQRSKKPKESNKL
jgi:hypothetical protein